ncbi:MAG: glutamyl-tRNA reductase [Bacteroidota bacterium]
MNRVRTIAFTHRNSDVHFIGRFHLEQPGLLTVLERVKSATGIAELMYLSTCNRVEFVFVTEGDTDAAFMQRFFNAFNPSWTPEEIGQAVSSAQVLQGPDAVQHFFKVASSLDSMVVGEREIITQLRSAYEFCRENGLTGDTLRLLAQKAIECAKEVYTQTNIAKNPVSVVSLAYRKLRSLNVRLDARFLIIGAGVTNTTMAKYLRKHGFHNFTVFNRTLANGEKLAAALGGTACPLASLRDHTGGFDVIITCTGSGEKIITKDIYRALAAGDKGRKAVVDLAVPSDLDEDIPQLFDVHLISVSSLQEIARKNLKEREKELAACERIIRSNMAEFRKDFRERKVELAMSQVPKKVKEIRETAVREVFAKDIERLDERSRETLDKVIAYLEKKYISVPMKMAKEILIEDPSAE